MVVLYVLHTCLNTCTVHFMNTESDFVKLWILEFEQECNILKCVCTVVKTHMKDLSSNVKLTVLYIFLISGTFLPFFFMFLLFVLLSDSPCKPVAVYMYLD